MLVTSTDTRLLKAGIRRPCELVNAAIILGQEDFPQHVRALTSPAAGTLIEQILGGGHRQPGSLRRL
jgi:hypothetical protein